jgi:hypothetical protein
MNTNAPATNAPPAQMLDIAGPVAIPWDWRAWLVTALALLALALLAWWAWRRFTRPAAPAPAAPPLPPHLRALNGLEAALKDLAEPERFCTRVSGVLRTYLEERFGVNAPDRTTEEFLAELRRGGPLDAGQQALLADFLTGCDIVKFARHAPTEAELKALHQAAWRLVRETEPAPAPPPAPQPVRT